MQGAAPWAYDARRLRRWLSFFFLALAVPASILIYQAFGELKWQAFHQHRLLAEELVDRIDERLVTLVAGEQARPFTDYIFLNVVGAPDAGFLQRSELSAFPADSAVPGLIGYFQIDAGGRFSTPLLPAPPSNAAEFGIDPDDLVRRQALAERMRRILGENRLLQPAVGAAEETPPGEAEIGRSGGQTERPVASRQDMDESIAQDLSGEAPVVESQAAFDRLRESREKPGKRLEAAAISGLDLRLERRFQSEVDDGSEARFRAKQTPAPTIQARKERSLLPEPVAGSAHEGKAGQLSQSAPIPITIFESQLDPFEFSLLDGGHLVLYRKVWREGQRYIQGVLLETTPFLQGLVDSSFRQTVLSHMSNLLVSYQGAIVATYRGASGSDYRASSEELQGQLLYRASLSPPMDDLDLVLVINRLPPGPGGDVILWASVILALVLSLGTYLLYRLGLRQLELARQQQDFVSAVSHELKTPLTSIRMYGEMLLQGWVGEEKRRTYYRYIFDESERLSRLIENVLQLARMTRNRLTADLKQISVRELMAAVRPGIASQAERAGFELIWRCGQETGRLLIRIDADYFTQILINLVDNAIKFAAGAENRRIEVGCVRLGSDRVRFTVRDYGPGVARDQARKIFGLFYRSENELTRETSGTGIGLALVQQQVLAMKGRVDVIGRRPGAEFRLTFRAYESQEAAVGTEAGSA